MNYEKLNHIAANPSEISAEDARELENLTRSFPYFSLPYVLLSRFYAGTNDYRYEDTLHKTALRVSDRAWLYDFIHGNTLAETAIEAPPAIESIHKGPLIEELPEVVDTNSDASLLETVAEPESIVEEQIVAETEVMEIPASLEVAPENFAIESEQPLAIVEPEVPTEEIAIASELPLIEEVAPITVEALSAEPELEVVTEPILEEELNHANAMERTWEPDMSAATEESETAMVSDEDAVFEEIPLFDAKEPVPDPNVSIVAETTTTEDDTLLDSLLAQGSMLVPDVADSENETSLIEETADVKEVHTPKLPAAGSVYNIEDYYPASDEGDDAVPNDFFSWLGKPKYQPDEEPKKEEPKENKTVLIDKFISNPVSISRPKSEFFNAMDVAKKSETFPDAIVTETLAGVYLQQGNYAGAIRIYEKLALKFPEKSAYFATLVEKIKKEHHL